MATLTVTDRAADILRKVRADRSGVLTISIDGGCCEGTAPHLYEDYLLPYGAFEIGRAEGIPVYVPAHLRDQWVDARITLDLVGEDSSDAMSLETEHGVRLVLRED
jgi:uncharacterized protein (DUF779 family)